MIAFDELAQHCEKRWLETRAHQVLKGHEFTKEQQKHNEQLIDELLKNRNNLEKNPNLLKEYVSKDIIWNLHCLPEEQQRDFLRITKKFISEAKAFDEHMKEEEIFQALRNVWIILMLGLTLRGKLFYHKAIFSYSMLYPYTDNYLDDVNISAIEKERFNQRLHKRLKGHAYTGPSTYEGKIEKLIEGIEEVFDRSQFPEVYESLLCIQRGQEDSLKQQRHEDANLLSLSIRKGGSSVLADGYLMDGKLCKEEQHFCMEYGFALQLADDLQDRDEDKENCHFTLFSKDDCEPLAQQLLQFVQDMLKRQYFDEAARLGELIEKGCLLLILGAIVAQRKCFGSLFLKQVYTCLPVTVSGLKRYTAQGEGLALSTLMDLFINEKVPDVH